MDSRVSKSCGVHKEWRRIAKRERRRRLRRKAAREREAEEEELRAALERDAEYLNWRAEEERREKEEEEREKREHEERERLWLEEEVRAQEEWRILQKRKAKAKQQQLEQEEQIRKEFEAKQELIRKKEEEEKRKREEEIIRREKLQKEIDDYIDEGIKTPEALRESIDSQPGKELCPFFAKTAACRYGDTCSRNHRRVCLSKVILIPNFYSHFSLEKNSAEYDTDIALEYENSETRQHFREFYNDVVPELESFGRIKTLKLCCNTEIHLRGNLYVEYYTEREAARALRKIKGRWYAGRQLNCEFANLKSWRSAVCGMSKCPKGRACNFLHTFKNPHAEYDIKSPPRYLKRSTPESASKRSEQSNRSGWDEDISDESEDTRNWRWSISPELETTEKRSRDSEKQHRNYTDERYYHNSSRLDKHQDRSKRSKDRLSRSKRLDNMLRERGYRCDTTPIDKIRRSYKTHRKERSERSYKEERRSSKIYTDESRKRRRDNDKSYDKARNVSEKIDDKEYRSKKRKDPTVVPNKLEDDVKIIKKKSKPKWDSKELIETNSESESSSDAESTTSTIEDIMAIVCTSSPDSSTSSDSDKEDDNKR